jgi:hypothetical protein
MSAIKLRRRLTAVLFGLGFATTAHAGAPEQTYEPGPKAGAWQLEYNGEFGLSGEAERGHSVEVFRGISDRIALGVEVESEVSDGDFRVEEIGLGALVGLTGEGTAVEAALLLKAGVSTDGDFPQLESRLILERDSEKWNLLGNLNLRYEKGEESGTSLAYAATAHRKLSEHLALGVEASGQITRLGGFAGGFESAQYAGPSVALSWELGDDREVEVGLKYLRRLNAGDEHRDTARLVLGFSF